MNPNESSALPSSPQEGESDWLTKFNKLSRDHQEDIRLFSPTFIWEHQQDKIDVLEAREQRLIECLKQAREALENIISHDAHEPYLGPWLKAKEVISSISKELGEG